MQQEDPKDSRRRAASLPVPPDDQPQREGPRPSSPSLSTKAPDTVHKSHTVPVTTASHAIPNSDPSELSTPRWPGKEPVPKLQRRGLFANFAILPEIEDPYQYPRKTKWFIVLLAAYCAAAAPLGSAIFFPALSQISIDLGTSVTVVNLTIALYMLSLAIFPIWWASLSEVFGRRSIYIVSFALFIVFAALCAISTSITMLSIMRIFCAGAAASMQTVGAGTIADIWVPEERGKAMSFFYVGPLCGPLLAPIIGGAVTQRWTWRATMWFISIYGATGLLLVLFVLPETLPKTRPSAETRQEEPLQLVPTEPPPLEVVHQAKHQSLRRSVTKITQITHRSFIEPIKVVRYLRFPAVLLTVYYASITFGSLYVLNISIQLTFERSPYDFTMTTVGLLYLPPSLGYFISTFLAGQWMDQIMLREARRASRYDHRGQAIVRPEDRMRENAWLGAIVYPLALIVYGWTVQKGVHWIVPMIALFFFGLGSMILLSLTITMLTEFTAGMHTAGVALNNVMRNIFAAVGCIVAAPLIFLIGNGWLFTILGTWTLASASVVWSMKRYGSRWRDKMDEQLG